MYTTRLLFSVETLGTVDNVIDLSCKNIADKVVAFLKSHDRTPPSLPTDDSAEVNQRVIIGLGHYYNAHYARAFPEFIKALKADPANAQAQYWLAMSFHMAGLEDFAEIEFSKFFDRFPTHKMASEVRGLLDPSKGGHDE